MDNFTSEATHLINMTTTADLEVTSGANEMNITDQADDAYDADAQTVMTALRYINYVLQVVLLVFGLIGNVLTIFVMRSRSFSKLTSRLFLVALAISDSTLLIVQPFNKSFVMQLIGTDIRALSVNGCKAFFVIFRTAKMTSSWFIVFICFERFIAVWMPLHVKIVCNKRLAMVLIFLVYVVIGGFNTYWSRNSDIEDDNLCHPDTYDVNNPEEVTSYKLMLVIGSSLYTLIPISILILFTPCIIFKMCYHNARRKELTNSAQSTTKYTTQIYKSTAMLAGIMIAYIVLTMPVTVFHNVAFYAGMSAFGQNRNSFLVFREVAQMLEMVNYSINFLLYVFTSQQFRQALKNMICSQNFAKQRSSQYRNRSTLFGARRGNQSSFKNFISDDITDTNESTLKAKADDMNGKNKGAVIKTISDGISP